MPYYVSVTYPLPPVRQGVRDLMTIKFHGTDITYEVTTAGALIVRSKSVPTHVHAAYAPGNWYSALTNDDT